MEKSCYLFEFLFNRRPVVRHILKKYSNNVKIILIFCCSSMPSCLYRQSGAFIYSLLLIFNVIAVTNDISEQIILTRGIICEPIGK
jgi:hypothetical protein